MEKANNLRIGELGEDLAVKLLKNKGFSVICRNFRRKWGEIDIVCEQGGVIHFVEVKSVSRKTSANEKDNYRPEDNLHVSKALRLKRVIQTYIDENSIENDFVCDLVTVHIDEVSRTARIQFLKDIVF